MKNLEAAENSSRIGKLSEEYVVDSDSDIELQAITPSTRKAKVVISEILRPKTSLLQQVKPKSLRDTETDLPAPKGRSEEVETFFKKGQESLQESEQAEMLLSVNKKSKRHVSTSRASSLQQSQAISRNTLDIVSSPDQTEAEVQSDLESGHEISSYTEVANGDPTIQNPNGLSLPVYAREVSNKHVKDAISDTLRRSQPSHPGSMANVASTRVSPYQPPSGFQTASLKVPSSCHELDILSIKNLAGKQLWHVVAPSSIPISSLNEVLLRDIGKDKKLVHHKDVDYTIMEHEMAKLSSQYILLPSHKECNYQNTARSIVRSLHLHQFVQVSKDPEQRSSTANGAHPTLRGTEVSAPVQPNGLKIRYRPFGDVVGALDYLDFGESSSHGDFSNDEKPTDRQFRVPVGVMTGMHGEKRRSSNAIERDDTKGSISNEKCPRQSKAPKALNSVNDSTMLLAQSSADGTRLKISNEEESTLTEAIRGVGAETASRNDINEIKEHRGDESEEKLRRRVKKLKRRDGRRRKV